MVGPLELKLGPPRLVFGPLGLKLGPPGPKFGLLELEMEPKFGLSLELGCQVCDTPGRGCTNRAASGIFCSLLGNAAWSIEDPGSRCKGGDMLKDLPSLSISCLPNGEPARDLCTCPLGKPGPVFVTVSGNFSNDGRMVPPVDIRINHVATVDSLLRAEHGVYKGALLLEVEGNLFVGYLTMGDNLRRVTLRRLLLLLLLRTAYVIPVLDLVRVLVRVLSYQRCRPYLKQQKQHKAVPKRNTPTVGIVMVKVFKLGSVIPASHSNTNGLRSTGMAKRKTFFLFQMCKMVEGPTEEDSVTQILRSGSGRRAPNELHYVEKSGLCLSLDRAEHPEEEACMKCGSSNNSSAVFGMQALHFWHVRGTLNRTTLARGPAHHKNSVSNYMN